MALSPASREANILYNKNSCWSPHQGTSPNAEKTLIMQSRNKIVYPWIRLPTKRPSQLESSRTDSFCALPGYVPRTGGVHLNGIANTIIAELMLFILEPNRLVVQGNGSPEPMAMEEEIIQPQGSSARTFGLGALYGLILDLGLLKII